MNNDNLNIKRLYELLVDNKEFFIRSTLLFFFISLIFVFNKTNYYESKISLYAAGELDDSGLLGQYSKLAENFGITSIPSSNYYIPDIIDSRRLKKEIVTKKWNNVKSSDSLNLIQY